ncbi:MAG: hypothetical protein JKY48_14290 [Flavobacteriales bacterium]|nr:hypothetical protein [Flavobacteriales bacterium]
MTLSKKNEELNQFTLVEELGFAEIYLDDSKKVRMIKYLDNVVIDIEKAKKVVEVIYPFIVNGALYGMTDATAKNINITPDTRKLYSSNKSMNSSIIHVVVLKELYVRIITKMFISFDKPSVPTKIFNDFHKAYEYLLAYEVKFTAERNSSNVPSV